jgi:hypothetical protein
VPETSSGSKNYDFGKVPWWCDLQTRQLLYSEEDELSSTGTAGYGVDSRWKYWLYRLEFSELFESSTFGYRNRNACGTVGPGAAFTPELLFPDYLLPPGASLRQVVCQ